MSVSVDVLRMTHNGGTKFYEIAAYNRVGSNNSVIVLRWGKMSEYESGGQTKIENLARAAASAAAGAKFKEKQKRGYETSHTNTCINDDEEIRLTLSSAYPPGTVGAVMKMLGVSDEISALDEEDEFVFESEPETEVERGSDWASW